MGDAMATIPVDADTARADQAASAEGQKKRRLLLRLRLIAAVKAPPL
jgi:hypothetical protein